MRALLLLTLLLVVGCGQKGPLYLPGPPQVEVPPPDVEESGAAVPVAPEEAESAAGKKDKND